MTKCTWPKCRAEYRIDHRPSKQRLCWWHWDIWCDAVVDKAPIEVQKGEAGDGR